MARSYPCPHCGASVLPSDSHAAEKVTCPHCHAEVPNPAWQLTVARVQHRSNAPTPAKASFEYDDAGKDKLRRLVESPWRTWQLVLVFVCGIILFPSVCIALIAVLLTAIIKPAYVAIPVFAIILAFGAFLLVWFFSLRAARPHPAATGSEKRAYQELWIVGLAFLIGIPVLIAVGIIVVAACTASGGHI